jgi:membrane associated rhomboid family serine protease
MGIQNRDYYKENASRGGDWGLYDWTPVVKFIIIANIVVFLLQVLITRQETQSSLEALRKRFPNLDRYLSEKADDPEALEKLKKDHPEMAPLLREYDADDPFTRTQRISVVQEWCELDTGKVLHGQVWRLVTYAFCHDRLGVWHIFFNMLFLYWFGCTIESMYGGREFLLFYLTAAVVAGLAFVALDLYTGSKIPAIGASGSVMAVTMLYAWHFPRETIYLFWLIRVEIRWLVIFYVIVDLHPVLLALAGENFYTGVANSAHLGGLAFGFLYGRYQWRLEPLGESLTQFRWRWKAHARQLRIAPETRPQPGSDPVMRRVDELLVKISESGEASLTDEERLFLQLASERLKSRREGRG